ncbi:lysostaphin resistance A-like protein [Nesterenkonia populi]
MNEQQAPEPHTPGPYGAQPGSGWQAPGPYGQSDPYGQAGRYGQPAPQQAPGQYPPGQPQNTEGTRGGTERHPVKHPAKGFPARLWGQPDSDPGRLSWWDLLTAVPYFGFFLIGTTLLTLLAQASGLDAAGGVELTDEDWMGEFILNAVIFGILLALILPLNAKALIRSFRVFTHSALAWLKLLAVPGLWLVTILCNLLITVLIFVIFGEEPTVSENQAGLEEMMQVVPFWAALLLFGIVVPYIEEYFFRHQLVGKLSTVLNIWVCAAISILIFAGVHVTAELMTGDAVLIMTSLFTYLTMSVIMTLAYIFSGRSLAFAWFVHAFNNIVAVCSMYFLMPYMDDLALIIL